MTHINDIDYSLIVDWYGRSIPYQFRYLIPFAQRSNELTKEIISTPIHIDPKSTSAYMANGKCYLPGMFFLPDFYEKWLGVEWHNQLKAAIAIINGSQIHEALHHLLLGANSTYLTVLDDVKKQVKASYELLTTPEIKTEVMKNCFNIIEDVFTENYGYEMYSYIYPFNQLMAEIIFNEKSYDDACSKACSAESTHVDVLNFLNHYKHLPYYDLDNAANEMYREHLSILKRAMNVDLTLIERFRLSYELFKLLKKDHEDEENFDKGLTNKGLTNEDITTIDKVQLANNDLVNFANSKFNPTDLEAVKAKFQEVFDPAEMIEINVELIHVLGSEKDKRCWGYNKDIEKNPKFEGFAQYLTNARAMKETFVQPREIGQRLLPNRLANALVDGRIFSKRDTQVMGKNNPEIIFLLDLSGSMMGDLLDLVINTGYTIYDNLHRNAIPCAFYGHTTNDENCLVVGIASSNMPLMSKAIETTYNPFDCFKELHRIHNQDNGDGFAIKFVGQRFSEKPGKKVLAVLSDGQPACSIANYRRDTGIQHTKNSVENLRKSNVSVVSLSLERSVMKTNDEIYGKENNIEAYGDNFEFNMKKLIANVVI